MATLRLLSRLGRGRQAFALLLLLKTFIVASSEMILKKIDIIYPYLPDERDRSEISPVFRLGSGASGPIPGSNTDASQEPRMLTGTSNVIANVRGLRHRRESGHAEAPVTSRSIKIMSPIFCMSIICMMMPGGPNLTNGNVSMSNSRDFNYRTPPFWNPEQESSYSFRAYMTDISIWIMLTDLAPHQQCAAILTRLGGAARELARTISPQEIMNGGVINGQQLDPVTFLLTSLHNRFSALEEESRLQAMTEMLAFQRRQGEYINSLLARYDTVRQRAAVEGQFTMSIEGCSIQLLRAVGIGHQHLPLLLQPFNGQLPQNEQQFNNLMTQLRRYGHVSENAPGNIASVLHGPLRQARPGAYLTDGSSGSGHAEAAATQGSTTGAYMANSQAQGLWDQPLPAEPLPSR